MKISPLPANPDPLLEINKGNAVTEETGGKSLPEDYVVYRVKVFSDGKDSDRKSKVFAPDVTVYRRKVFEE